MVLYLTPRGKTPGIHNGRAPSKLPRNKTLTIRREKTCRKLDLTPIGISGEISTPSRKKRLN